MNFILERIADPAEEPVTLAEARLHLRIDDFNTDVDTDLTRLITTAREWAEEGGRALVDQTWRQTMTFDLKPDGAATTADAVGSIAWTRRSEITLRRSPVLAIASVKTVDSTGAVTTIDSATYEIREASSRWPRLVTKDGSAWGVTAGVDLRIEYRAGFLDTVGSPSVNAVPERFRQAILLHVDAHFNRDEKMMDMLLKAATNLIRNERSSLGMA